MRPANEGTVRRSALGQQTVHGEGYCSRSLLTPQPPAEGEVRHSILRPDPQVQPVVDAAVPASGSRSQSLLASPVHPTPQLVTPTHSNALASANAARAADDEVRRQRLLSDAQSAADAVLQQANATRLAAVRRMEQANARFTEADRRFVEADSRCLAAHAAEQRTIDESTRAASRVHERERRLATLRDTCRDVQDDVRRAEGQLQAARSRLAEVQAQVKQAGGPDAILQAARAESARAAQRHRDLDAREAQFAKRHDAASEVLRSADATTLRMRIGSFICGDWLWSIARTVRSWFTWS